MAANEHKASECILLTQDLLKATGSKRVFNIPLLSWQLLVMKLLNGVHVSVYTFNGKTIYYTQYLQQQFNANLIF